MVVSGGKESRTYGILKDTGEILYECSMNDCTNFQAGVCKVPSSQLRGGGGVYQVIVTRGREYHSCGEEYNVKIRETYYIKAVERNIKCGRGEGDGHFGVEDQDLKNVGGEEYHVV